MKIRVAAILGCVLMLGTAALAQDSPPKVEIPLDYSHMWFTPQNNSIVNKYQFNGGGGGLTFYLTRNFGIEADFQDYASDTHTFTYPASAATGTSNTLCPAGCAITAGGDMFTYNFGPIFKLRRKHFEPFIEGLVGGARTDLYTNLFKDCPSCVTNGEPSRDALDVIAGGGIDVPVSTHIAIRLIQVDYVWTRFNNSFTGGNQNNVRLNAGIVFREGGEKPKAPDVVTASCSVDKSSIMADSGDMISAMAQGSDSYSHPINYTWAATGGKVDGSGPQVRWQFAGVAPGTYTISAHLDDGRGNNASCSSDVTVSPKPVPPAPTMSCSADPSSVQAGERSTVTATVNDSTGTALTYAWQANSGQVVGTGASVQFDSTGLAPGDYTVTGRATNANGAAADCTTTVTVQQPPAKPEASKVGQCTFKLNSARVDNVCKRVLDDAAVRLQNDPKAKIVIVGYSDPKEKKADKLAKDRADSASMYLSKTKNVDASRVETRTTAGTAGADTENRRVDVMNVPDGATF